MKGDYVMTEKDLELQDLKRAYAKIKEELAQCQSANKWMRDRLVEVETERDVARSDLYKAVVYDCKCSLCGVYESCSKVDMEEGCFIWKKDLAAN